MQRPTPRPSNLLIRAFVLIFATLALFVVGLIVFNITQVARENPEEQEELQHLR